MLTHLSVFAGQREGTEVAPTRGLGDVFGGLAGVFLVEFEVSAMVVLAFLWGRVGDVDVGIALGLPPES